MKYRSTQYQEDRREVSIVDTNCQRITPINSTGYKAMDAKCQADSHKLSPRQASTIDNKGVARLATQLQVVGSYGG